MTFYNIWYIILNSLGKDGIENMKQFIVVAVVFGLFLSCLTAFERSQTQKWEKEKEADRAWFNTQTAAEKDRIVQVRLALAEAEKGDLLEMMEGTIHYVGRADHSGGPNNTFVSWAKDSSDQARGMTGWFSSSNNAEVAKIKQVIKRHESDWGPAMDRFYFPAGHSTTTTTKSKAEKE